MLANSADSDQTLHSAASYLGLHCLPTSHKMEARLIRVYGLTGTFYAKPADYLKQLIHTVE